MAHPWVRYDLNFIDHPKFLALSAGAICLWLEGKNYCDVHLTDGMIPRAALKGFRFCTRGRVAELAATIGEKPSADAQYTPLWEAFGDVGGFRMHDYLAHNQCRDEVLANVGKSDARKAQRAANQQAYRDRQRDQPRDRPRADNGSVTVTDHQHQHQHQHQNHRPSDGRTAAPANADRPTNARSKRPIFTGQRLTVFEWQLDNCLRTLGSYADPFDLHEWFFELDAMAVSRGLVIPKRDGGEWLQAQLVAEAQRRGLPLQMATAGNGNGKGPRPAGDLALARDPYADWQCPHTPKCHHPTACQTLITVGRIA